jgi:hypothetical protein
MEEKNAEIEFYKRKIDELTEQYGGIDTNRDIAV